MLTLHLMRHFQTPCSAAGLYCSNCPTGLTPQGTAMAEALAAQRGRPNAWQAIYTSTMPRARASAAPFAEACGLVAEPIEGIQELDYGAWEGQTRDAVRARDGAFFNRWELAPANLAPPQGETVRQVADRAMLAVAELQRRHPSGEIFVVSHKATLRALLCALLGVDLNLYRARLAQALGGISVVDMTPRGALLRSLGDVGYLPGQLRGLD